MGPRGLVIDISRVQNFQPILKCFYIQFNNVLYQLGGIKFRIVDRLGYNYIKIHKYKIDISFLIHQGVIKIVDDRSYDFQLNYLLNVNIRMVKLL